MSLYEKTQMYLNKPNNWIPIVDFCRIAGLGGEIKDLWSCPHWWVSSLFLEFEVNLATPFDEILFPPPAVFNFHQAVDGIQEQQRQQQEGKK